MTNPFPGMNPYLEDRALWNDFHASVVIYIRNALQPHLRPRYVARVEERVYLEFTACYIAPDVALFRRRRPDSEGGGGAAVLERCARRDCADSSRGSKGEPHMRPRGSP
jgi:hypothetical protein